MLECLRYATRAGALTKFSKEMRLMRLHFDLAFQKSLCHLKSQGQLCSVWFESVKDIAGIIVYIKDVEAVLSCTTS